MAQTVITPAKPVTFAAGSPIDPDALNTLMSNISKLVSESATLANTVDGTSSKVSSFSDSITIPASGVAAKTITLTTTRTVQIFIQPKPPTNSKKTLAITTSYEVSGQTATLAFFTNGTYSGSLDFDYMIVERTS